MAACETIAAGMAAKAAEHPDKTALVYLSARYSYAQVHAWSLSFAARLAELGVGRGDRVMIYLPNCPQWVAAWLGMMIRGAVAVPLSPIYPAEDLAFVARDSGAQAIICSNENYGYVEQVAGDAGFQWVLSTAVTDLLPAWKRALAVLFDKKPRGRVPRRPGNIPLKRLFTGPADPGLTPPGPKDLATLLYTGGTAGRPKGAPYTQELFLAPIETQLAVADPVIAPGENVVALATPLFHILGLTFGLAPLYLRGDTIILFPEIQLDGMMAAIDRQRAQSFFAVPALYRQILEHDRLGMYDLSSLKYCFSGGDVLTGRVGQRWREYIGAPISLAYGATETAGGVSLSPPDRENPIRAVGRVLPDKEVRVVDPETLEALPQGRAGELWVRSDPMVTSYWRRPRRTAAAFVQADGKPWYRTGDIMRLDAEGYLYFIDRVADAVSPNGAVSITEIESALQEHPAVTAACVVGAAEDDRLKAFVVLKENQRGVAGSDLTAWLAARLPEHKVPQYIEFRDALPKSKVGKLLRRELKGEEEELARKGRWDQTVED